MNYIYDVLANFQNECYDFYEWNKTDNISRIRKVPIIKVNNNLYYDLKNNKIRISKDFLLKIENKTEVFKEKYIEKILYCAIFTNSKEALIIIFDNKGNNKFKSSMIIDEEYEVLSDISDYNEYEIEYELILKNEMNFITRKENKKIEKAKKEINKLFKNNEKDKLEYLYFECFNKKNNNSLKIKDELILNLNNSKILYTIENFIKLIYKV